MSNFLLKQQLNKLLVPWHKMSQSAQPREGWIRSLRQGLSITTTYLGRKLDLSPSNITMIEQREQQGTVTLQTLAKVAAAMNCRLVYALVPQGSIDEVLYQEALKKAQMMLQATNHTMALEGQASSSDAVTEQIEALAQELLQQPKKLWEVL